MGTPYSIDGDRITVRVHVQPRSSSVQWGKTIDNEWIQLRITAPPVDGAANKMCRKVVAARFKTAKSNVRIVQGEKSRYKTIVAEACDPVRLASFQQAYPSV